MILDDLMLFYIILEVNYEEQNSPLRGLVLRKLSLWRIYRKVERGINPLYFFIHFLSKILHNSAIKILIFLYPAPPFSSLAKPKKKKFRHSMVIFFLKVIIIYIGKKVTKLCLFLVIKTIHFNIFS